MDFADMSTLIAREMSRFALKSSITLPFWQKISSCCRDGMQARYTIAIKKIMLTNLLF